MRDITYHISAYIVIEVAIQAQYVGMAQVRLDLNFSAQLVLHIRVAQLILEQDLQQRWQHSGCCLLKYSMQAQ